MPELPEVETLRRQLVKTVIGEPLLAVLTIDNKLLDISNLIGHRIVNIDRRGKNLLLAFDNSRVLSVHLRMTGRLLWQDHVAELPQYTRLVMTFPHGRVAFVDPRRFMTLAWERTFPARCGPEPLSGLDPAALAKRAKTRKGPIKSFLLDQSVIAGIGNIYVCEILHAAAINPAKPAWLLDTPEWEKILTAIEAILNKAVVCRGTSISDWRDFYGCQGSFQHELQVYNRKGSPCPRCGEAIQRISLGGRGTYFCPGCQE